MPDVGKRLGVRFFWLSDQALRISGKSEYGTMSSAKLGNQDRPQNGKQVMQAPAWEIGEAGRQVGVPAGPDEHGHGMSRRL